MIRKILIISWHFPPYKSSSSFNLFKRLKDTGYDFDVIQVRREGEPDNSKMYNYASSKFTSYEITVSSENSRDLTAREEFIENVIKLYKTLKITNHYSVILSHSHEFASHLAALKLKSMDSNLPWIASFGDPIAANPYNDEYKFPLLEEDSQSEKEVLREADRIIVTNKYQRDLMISSHERVVSDDKFFILPHCYDSNMYKSQVHTGIQSSKKIFKFMHVGMLYKYKRTSEPFLLGSKRLLEKHPELRDKFTVDFYGANDQFIKKSDEYGLAGIVNFKGNVSYLDSLSVMLESDCLLLRDADFSDQGISHTPFYPGKLADYFGAGKPVIAVTMKHGCVPDMIANTGGACLTEDNIEGIAIAMKNAIDGQILLNQEEVEKYSHENISNLAKKALIIDKPIKTILIAGHDLKFAKLLIDELESKVEFKVLIDQWEGHNKHNEIKSRELLNQADIIFCEWGLGNLVWYSHNKKQGQKLITRIHAQELKTRHLDQCNHSNIDNYIFVSPYYFELMIAEFSLERKKCKMIFNMVDIELLNKPKLEGAEFNLGMIGDVPQSKRLDRALDLFELLYQKDKRYKLYIKGKRPEEYSWMHSKGKSDEMAFYQTQYDRIKNNGWEENVIFDGYGPIDEWLRKIGWILSMSDHESFHLAVAEGMASGAVPLIYSWEGADTIYSRKYIHKDISEIISFIFEGSYPLKENCNIFDKEVGIARLLDLFKD